MLVRLFQLQHIQAPRNFQPIPQHPIILEIGAGKGKHALLLSQQYPQQPIYAIERTAEKFLAMQKQHQQHPGDQLYPIHADAIAWTVYALYPKQVERCFILYPNPEPHNATQRWLNMPFFEFLLSRMADGGQITIASNIESYIVEAEQQLQHCWQLPYIKQTISQDSARTHFEIKYLQRGEWCQELIITKPQGYVTRFDDQLPKHAWR